MAQTYPIILRYRHSHLWLWLLISAIIHILILILLFVRFESMQFKKGASQNPHMKVAGFQILGGNEYPQESQEPNMPSPAPSAPPSAKSQINKQMGKNFDLRSLSLYDGKSRTPQDNTVSTSSHIKALAKFPRVDHITKRDIEDLYGEEFGDYGIAEQEFLVNNLRDIGRITQRYLQYPPSAARLGQQGVSAVEFYLHPNGDISGLKVIVSSEYMLLDRNSKRTIEIAYKDYPHPSTKTKIRIFVTYGLYYYGY
ncbi:TonB family protein [Helicobacter mastomyrinus]|uniref:TonB family protein n=1 Tax=Helicobacter mastomyrinus TaxID=287948 RepID=A0ABZ3F3H7_9HELI